MPYVIALNAKQVLPTNGWRWCVFLEVGMKWKEGGHVGKFGRQIGSRIDMPGPDRDVNKSSN
jgi:hypothetical protein